MSEFSEASEAMIRLAEDMNERLERVAVAMERAASNTRVRNALAVLISALQHASAHAPSQIEVKSGSLTDPQWITWESVRGELMEAKRILGYGDPSVDSASKD